MKRYCMICLFEFSIDDVWYEGAASVICLGCWERNVPENVLPFPKGLRRELSTVLNGLQGYDSWFKEVA